jgi:hypothetical protein
MIKKKLNLIIGKKSLNKFKLFFILFSLIFFIGIISAYIPTTVNIFNKTDTNLDIISVCEQGGNTYGIFFNYIYRLDGSSWTVLANSNTTNSTYSFCRGDTLGNIVVSGVKNGSTAVFRYNIASSSVTNVSMLSGKYAYAMTIDSSNNVYFTEYASSTSVNSGNNTWKCTPSNVCSIILNISSYSTVGANLRHFHSIYYDTFSNCLYVGAGDIPIFKQWISCDEGATFTDISTRANA